MKKILLSLTLIVFLFSCEKNREMSINDSITTSSNLEYQIANNENSNVTFESSNQEQCENIEVISSSQISLLHFSDLNCFNQTVAYLENQVELLDDEFINTYADLDEEELNLMEEQIGFNEEQPLIDFENNFGFSSLRQQIEEDSYIYNGLEDPQGEDPFYDIIYDESIQTLLNSRHEVAIDNAIYKMNQDGSYWIIEEVNLELLELLNENIDNPNYLLSIPQISLQAQMMPIPCGRDRERGSKTSGSYKMKWKMKLYSAIWGGGLKVKVKGYKKKGWRWKKRRSYCKVGWKGLFCDGSGNLTLGDPNWIFSDRYNKKRWSWKTSGTTKSKDKEITGYFQAVGISHTEVLDIN